MTPKEKPAPAWRPAAGIYQRHQSQHYYVTVNCIDGQDWCSLCAEIGLVKYDFVPVDEKIHGVGTVAHPHSKNGRVFRRLDNSGWAWNHETGERRGWQPGHSSGQTSPDFHRRKQTVEAERRTWEADQERRYREAAEQAARIWEVASPANPQHPYLQKKQIGAYGIRESRNRLVVPVFSGAGQIQSIQFISADGIKRFLSGGKLAGGRFQIGDVTDPAGVICVGEGFSTVATLRAETDYPCFVAFSAGNLEHVAVSVRAKFPKAKIIIAGDNDHETEAKTGKNPGLEAAKRAAAACGGRLMIPPALPDCSDWNDIIRLGGDHAQSAE